MDEKSKLERLIAPDVEARKAVRNKINDYAYYVMIMLVSLLTVFIPPLILGGVTGAFDTVIPQSPQAWIVWIVLNVSTAIGNMSILVFFKLQAKKNSLNHPNYQEATRILNELSGNKNVFVPRSPTKMNAKEYTTKTLCILVSTFTSFLTISLLVINFSLMCLISSLVSAIIALIISWTTMLKNEEYWTEEYLLYAKMIEKKFKDLESLESEELKEEEKCLISETKSSETCKNRC